MLQPPQLLFLLQDLNSKLSSTLSAFGSKRLGTKVSHWTITWCHVTVRLSHVRVTWSHCDDGLCLGSWKYWSRDDLHSRPAGENHDSPHASTVCAPGEYKCLLPGMHSPTSSLPHLLTPPPNPLPTQAQLEESDGVVDAESSHQDFPALCTTFHLLLKTMAAFFGW